MLFSACGTGTTTEVPDDRFDMWEYMTATVDYEVEYDFYEDDKKMDYYVEKHRMFKDLYKREGSKGVITLALHKRDILMKEESRDITVERYVHLEESGVFTSNSIKDCQLKAFYKVFKNREQSYDNVVMVSCISNSGVEQEFFYGYNEGVVSMFENDHGVTKEWVKVKEKRID